MDSGFLEYGADFPELFMTVWAFENVGFFSGISPFKWYSETILALK